MFKTLIFSPVLLIAACSNGGKSDPATPAAASTTRPTLNQRMNEQNGYAQDSEGNWAPKIDRRSQFEKKQDSPYFKGDYAKKNYKAGDYEKKPFWGTKEVDRKVFDGKTDGSRFQQTSKFGDQKTRESGMNAKIPDSYETNNYAAGTAREQGSERMSKPSDAETDIRRRAYKAPGVLNWEEQRAMSVSQTKGLLGRD